MSTFHTDYSTILNATPADVYALFRDYRIAHAAVLPKPYFAYYEVQQGGMGAGTVFRADMDVFGSKSTLIMTVTEPEPGRIMVEEDAKAGMTTSFTLDPVENGQKTRVTIHNEMRASAGIRGVLERLTTPPIMRMIFKKELQNVAQYLATRTPLNA
jgi:hypothetical protein